jgi:5-methylcytosine-specific restriction endonuclease McrA
MPRRTKPLECRGEVWEKQRMRALVRDEFTCQAHRVGLPACDETRLRVLHVHHILPRSNGGTHDLDNLVTLCRACHARVHPWMVWDRPMRQRELPADGGRELPMGELEREA